ncbi:MAG: outer membrane beta-barrel protein [Methylococcaceae bacterium]
MNNTLKTFALAAVPLVCVFSTHVLAGDDLGLKLGSFNVMPVLESNNEWKSNIYSSQQNTIDDVVFHTKPSVAVKSDWSQHALNLLVNSDIQNYANHDHEDRNNYSFNLDGRFDVMRNSFATAKFSYANQYENRGSPDSVFHDTATPLNSFIALAPTNYQLIDGYIGYDHKINRVRISVDNDTQHYGYVNGMTSNGTVIDNNRNRSRLQNTSTIKLGYELFSGYEAFVRGSYNFTDYDSQFNGVGGLNDKGVQRSSTGYNLNTGVSFDVTGKIIGEVHLGYQERSYADASLKAISGMSGGLSLVWKATGLTTVNASISRSINETTQQDASGYMSTPLQLSVKHELLRNLILNASVGYTINDYTGAGNGGKGNRAEDNYNANFGVNYLINRHLYLNGGYNFSSRITNVTNTNYDISSVFITLGLKY